MSFMALSFTGLSIAGAGEIVKRQQTPVKKSMQWLAPGDTAKSEFDFGEAKAILRGDGEWFIEGMVKHNRVRCATYRLGIRFGVGSKGCANVEWIAEPIYASSRKQCNSAILNHSGGNIMPELSADFEKITCAQKVIKCSGVCN